MFPKVSEAVKHDTAPASGILAIFCQRDDWLLLIPKSLRVWTGRSARPVQCADCPAIPSPSPFAAATGRLVAQHAAESHMPVAPPRRSALLRIDLQRQRLVANLLQQTAGWLGRAVV